MIPVLVVAVLWKARRLLLIAAILGAVIVGLSRT